MTRLSPRLLALAAACALVATAACKDDRADITDPVGRVYNSHFSKVGSNLPRGTATQVVRGTSPTDSIRVTLQGMETLKTGEYKIWLGNQATAAADPTDVIPATGLLRIVTTDTTFTPQGDPIPVVHTDTLRDASAFTAGGARVTVRLTVDSASLQRAGAANRDPAHYNLVFVTIEPTTGATAPTATAPHPLWARLFGLTGTTRTATVNFGNFDPDPAKQYIFQASGRGLIGIWDKILTVDDSALALPPKGYYYATVLTRGVPRAGAPDSTDIVSIQLGPQKAPYPRRTVSLFDADVQDVDPVVSHFPPSILAAGDRVSIDTMPSAILTGAESQPYRGYRLVNVTLETKQGADTPSQSVILTAAFPEPSSKPPSQ